MHWIKFFIAGFVFWALPALADDHITEFTLENGMEVVVIEDHRAPAVLHMVWYRTGSADDPIGKSGLAHYLEHLMFKSTTTQESGAFSRFVESVGGSENAMTSWDYTAYFQRVAVEHLPRVMALEADRMVNLSLDPAEVATELSVILEERGEVVESNPSALFMEQMRAALFPDHPYGIPIIGWRDEMAGLTRADVMAHYAGAYAPNNAVLILAGAIDPESARRLAEDHYGPVPAREIAPRPRAELGPKPPLEQSVTFEDQRVAQPLLGRLYRVAEAKGRDPVQAAALTLLAQILGGNPATSVLGEALQFQAQSAVFTSASYRATALDDSSFSIVIVPSAGRAMAQVEADLNRVIADFLAQGIDPEQFERIKFQFRAAEIYAQDSVQGMASVYGAALTTGRAVSDVQTWPDQIAAVTMEEVMEAARALFADASRVTGYLTAPATGAGGGQ